MSLLKFIEVLIFEIFPNPLKRSVQTFETFDSGVWETFESETFGLGGPETFERFGSKGLIL